MPHVRTTVLILAALFGSGCDSPVDPAGERHVGIIGSEHLQAPPLRAPDTVQAGVAFSVTVTTLGLDGCWRADGVGGEREKSRIELIPYDRVVDGACHQALVELPRTLQLRFAQPGAAVIHLSGRSSADAARADVRITRQVWVR